MIEEKKGKSALAIDIGASSGRIISGTLSESVIRIEEQYRFSHQLVNLNGDVFWDFPFIWNKVKEGVNIAGTNLGNIESLAIDTFSPDSCFIDEKGKLPLNMFSYHNLLGSNILEKILQKIHIEKFYQITGTRPFEILLLPQIVMLIEKGRKELFEKYKFVPLSNTLSYLFCGNISMDFTNASISMMWDRINNRFSRKISNLFIPTLDFLPPLIENGAEIGRLSNLVKDQIILKEVRVINSGSHDTAVATYFLDIKAKGQVCISSGTWSSIGIVLDAPLVNPQVILYELTNYGIPDGRYMLCKLVPGLFYIQEIRNFLKSTGHDYSFEDLSNLAKKSNFCFSLNVESEILHDNKKTIIERIVKCFDQKPQNIPKSTGDFVKCIYLSIAEKYQEIIDNLELSTGNKYDEIYLGGGAVNDNYFCQLIADITRRKVHAVASEVSALGNLIRQYISLKEITCIDAEIIIDHSVKINEFLPKS